MSRNTRDQAKRDLAAVVQHIDNTQEFLSRLWVWTKEDPRDYKDRFDLLLTLTEDMKAVMEQISLELFDLKLEDLASWR